MRNQWIRTFFFLFACAPLFAQTASITGRVTDSTQAVVPGAKIVVIGVQTGFETSAETNDAGYYNVASLPPGAYEVSVTSTGFKPIRQTNLQLIVQQVARLDFALEVGSLSETVEVSARSVLLDSETATLGQVVGSGQLVNLPLLGRNPYALAGLVPGVRISATMNDLPVDQISQSYASINGQRSNQNEYLLDGAPNTAAAQNQPVVFANVDAVQEFKVETNSFRAEYGRASGGVFNVVTKSGTNDPHFTLYEFLRNNSLNANNFFANMGGQGKAPFRFNQFGGTFGGPVVLPHLYKGRDKTFFFGSMELVRFAQGVVFTGTMPTAQQLAGDFSATRNAAGNVIAVYDPFSTRPSGTAFVRSPFPGNIIPQDRINPISRNIAKYFPAPNAPGNPVTGVNNYFRNGANQIEKNTFSARVDHYFNESNRFFTRFNFDNTPNNRARTYGDDSIATPTAGPQVFARRNAVIEDTETFSPTLLGVFRYSYTRLGNQRKPYSDGFDITTLGFPAGLSNAIGAPISFPAITVTGLSVSSSIANIIVGGVLGASDLIRLGCDTHAGMAQVTKTFSQHVVKTGLEFRLIRANMLQHGDSATNFSFANTWTQGPNPAQSSAGAGVGLATMLLGVAGGSVSPAPGWAQQQKYYAAFVQDDWRATSRLTVNLGVRYDFESPRTDRFNQFTNFDFGAKPPLNVPSLDLRGVLTFPGVGGIPRTQTDPDRNNIAPRLGVAYKLDPKTVLRSGFGMFYTGTTGVGTGAGSFGISGFQTTTTLLTSLDGITPLNTISNPYPTGIIPATGSSLGAATLLGQTVNANNRKHKVPYALQWNFNIQRELPGSVVFDIGYAASRGLNYNIDQAMNQLPAETLKLGDALRQQVTNPFYGQISTGILSQRTVSRAQLLRPYPQYDAFTYVFTNGASSSYHALQAKVEKRYAHGFTVMAAYTFSKMIDEGTGGWSGETLGGSTSQDSYDRHSERGVSGLNQTHRFISNLVYALPGGRLKGAPGKLLGGWEFGAVLSFFSGGPLGMSATNSTFAQGGGQRPNWTGKSAKLENRTLAKWFDTSQFSQPAAYTFGNAPRTFSDLLDDGTRSVDVSLHKNTRLTEKLNLQFRAEFFNLTNTVRFGPPNQALGNNQFGVVSTQSNQPRIIQFALKLMM